MNHKILLIEDSIELRENTAEILELAGYTVVTPANGKEGVELASTLHPDLIICDIMMPVLDGYGVLHLLSKKETTASIPFIFLTAKAERTDMRKGMDMGADDYLTKPFDDIELLNAVESRFKKTEILKKEFSKSVEGVNSFMQEVKDVVDLKELSLKHELKEVRKKIEVYKEGQYPKGIYYLNKGKVKTAKTGDNGKEFITGLYNEGDFFGYLSVIEEKAYADTATALEDVELYFLPKEAFQKLLFKNAAVSQKFIKLLSNSLREREEQLVKLAYNSVRKKVADALIKFHESYANNQPDFIMQVSREDLANLAGIATESTIRTLSEFKDEKLIEINAGKITIVNIAKLKSMRN
jgi:CRP-like cAMP-binding protein/CheY-like chemotaxis protein